MSEDRLHQIRRGFYDGASQGDEPPDLGPLRALAEREELADAAARCVMMIRCGRWPVTSPGR